MKGIRGLLEKDFRLFFRQGSNLFLVLVVLALFFILTGKTGATFIAMYIPSVMAVYSGNTISYDENEHGYTYLFSLPVNKKIYVREKYMFSFIMTVFGWGIGVICAGIAVFIKPGEVFDLEMLAMELITIFVFQAIAGIVIAIRLRFAGEKGRFALPIAVLIVFASCYIIGSFVTANSGLKESISYMIGETGDFEIIVAASSRDPKLTAEINVESTVDAQVPDYRQTAPNYYNNVANITRDDFAAVYGELPNPEIDTNKKIDLYCCLNDARHTKWGGKLCNMITKIMSGMGSDANGDGKMLAAMATQIPIRNFIAMSMGVFSPKMADGLLMMLNDDESSFVGFNKIFWRLGGALTRLPALLKSI